MKPGTYIDSSLISKLEVGKTLPKTPLIAGDVSLDQMLSGLIPSNPFSVLVGGQMLQVVLLPSFLGSLL